MPADFNPHLLQTDLRYVGPEGLELDVTAMFADNAPLGPTITRTVPSLGEIISEIVHWVDSGCTELKIRFNGIGSVSMNFSQPTYSEADVSGVASGVEQ